MGLFSSVLHVYHQTQDAIVRAFTAEIKERQEFSNFARIEVAPDNLLTDEVFTGPGVFYLITQPHGHWTTIVEMAINTQYPVFLYEFANKLSEVLHTYALSFHLHDGDVVYYDLAYAGRQLDHYRSDWQYFLAEKLDAEIITKHRHNPRHFAAIMPVGKTVEVFNELLNEGYWTAFDNNDLDEGGVPADDKYFIDEEARLVNIGTYLEIFNKTEYPFANWYEHTDMLEQGTYYILHANE